MPELPEVETVRRLIRPSVVGRRIEGVRVGWERTLGGQTPRSFGSAVRGAHFTDVGRRAKYLVLSLEREGASAGALVIHLRMTGRLQVVPREQKPSDWLRVSMDLEGDTRLEFIDVRKFGRVLFTRDPGEILGGLGPEPLSDDFSEEWLLGELRVRRRMLKPLLLDQSFLAGLGNIYVDEALHQAKLHPEGSADRVCPLKARALYAAIRTTLEEAIKREGSSFDTFYRTPEGQPGSYQHQFQVYGRDGKPCRRCGHTLVKIVVGQRGTHLCRRCQPKPRKL
ncbi:MAG: formamidopyrimidine-DNA glycosylase [Planctomycetota bacterium]|jgi:formamidopyrimidine-DNA glycosylase